MKTENKIVIFLAGEKKEMTIRELSRAIKSDYKIVHTAVRRLIDKGVLENKKIGQSILVNLSNKMSKEILEGEFERREDVLKNKNLRIMLDRIMEELKTSNFILLLFGSYARKKETKKSDIDLMFIVQDEKFEKEVEKIISLLPLKIHFLVFSEKQFRDMKDSRELNVAKEAIKNNVILHGIEQYYNLIK